MPKTFKDLVRESEGFKGFSTGVYASKDYTMIPINQICCRSVNKYVDKQDVAESLKNSIKKLGLIEPIIVIEIESYKKKLNEEDPEYAYLCEMQGKGCNYFISSGHRRFKAFISLALKRDMYPRNQIDYLYSDEVRNEINQYYTDREEGFINGVKPEYRFYEIPCKIEKKLLDNENEFYNQSNSTQRELTNYEVIINTIDSLEKNGTMDRFRQDAVDRVVDSLSSRSLSEWINDYIKQGLLDKEAVSGISTDDDKRNILKTLPPETISKTKKIQAQSIEEYILEDSGREISAAKIMQTMAMLEQLDELKNKTGFDVMSLVYAGEMNFRDVIELSRIVDQLSTEEGKKELEEHLINPVNEARKKNQELGQLKDSDPEQYGNEEYVKIADISKNSVKVLKDKFSEKKKDGKKISFTNAELIEFIYAIDRGDTTAREVIKKIEKLYKN